MFRFGFIIFCSFVLYGCTRDYEKYKRPTDIFVLDENLNRNENDYPPEPTNSLSYATFEEFVDDPYGEILGKDVLTFPVYMQMMGTISEVDTTRKSEVKEILLLKSDRICKRYLDYILDIRTTTGVGQKIAEGLPNFLGEFVSPTHTVTNVARRVAIAADALETGLSKLGLEENYFKNTAKNIISLRKKMKDLILLSFGEEKYKDYLFYIDLEHYHNSCSIYDRILFNRSDPEFLKELTAYRILDQKDNSATDQLVLEVFEQ